MVPLYWEVLVYLPFTCIPSQCPEKSMRCPALPYACQGHRYPNHIQGAAGSSGLQALAQPRGRVQFLPISYGASQVRKTILNYASKYIEIQQVIYFPDGVAYYLYSSLGRCIQ